MFSHHVLYDTQRGYYGFAWTEHSIDELRRNIVDRGQRIAFIDKLLAGTKLPVAEYFNTLLGHYFLAVDSEWGAIDRGDAGPGWQRTGLGFTVRSPAESPISVTTQRFYGSVSPGPNSHFFTIDMAEYKAMLRDAERTPPSLPRWHSEGRSFNAFSVLTGPACAEQKVPVYRVFNGGVARGLDPNHRFTVVRRVADEMIALGWVDEGVAFCVDAP